MVVIYVWPTLKPPSSTYLVYREYCSLISKYVLSVAAPRVWNELPITLKTSETIAILRKKLIYSKLHFHHKSSVVSRSDNDFCASLFTIMLNDSVFLRL